MKNLFGEEIIKDTEEDDFEKHEEKKSSLLGVMFTKKKEFEKIPLHEKEKQFFILQRFFAIKQPLISMAFNKLKINGGRAVECWGRMLGNIYNVQPPWIFATLNSMKKRKTEKTKTYSEGAIQLFCKKNMMSRRDFETYLKYCPEKVQNELDEYEMYLHYNVSEKRKNK